MKIVILSSLKNESQKGGAYLRVHAISKIYKLLGAQVDIRYMDEFRPKLGLKGIFISILLRTNLNSLFNTDAINLSEYDYIHFDNLRFFNWKINRGKAKIIYSAHNLEFESYFPENRQISRAIFRWFELQLYKKSYINFVCSDREKKQMVKFDKSLDKKIFVLPNLLDQNLYYKNDEKKTILFVGTLDYFPNVQAIKYLLDDFIDNVPQSIIDSYQFVIAGRNPLPWMKGRAEEKGFIFKENLDDYQMKKLLASSAVSLVPILHGSGTRLKIIESIFSGAFVLSTKMGAEGIVSDQIFITPLENFPRKLVSILDKNNIPDENLINEFKKNYDFNNWFQINAKKLKMVMGIE